MKKTYETYALSAVAIAECENFVQEPITISGNFHSASTNHLYMTRIGVNCVKNKYSLTWNELPHSFGEASALLWGFQNPLSIFNVFKDQKCKPNMAYRNFSNKI